MENVTGLKIPEKDQTYVKVCRHYVYTIAELLLLLLLLLLWKML